MISSSNFGIFLRDLNKELGFLYAQQRLILWNLTVYYFLAKNNTCVLKFDKKIKKIPEYTALHSTFFFSNFWTFK